MHHYYQGQLRRQAWSKGRLFTLRSHTQFGGVHISIFVTEISSSTFLGGGPNFSGGSKFCSEICSGWGGIIKLVLGGTNFEGSIFAVTSPIRYCRRSRCWVDWGWLTRLVWYVHAYTQIVTITRIRKYKPTENELLHKIFCSVSPKSKRKGVGGERYNFSIRSKQIKHSNDHIKGNRVRKGGGGHPFGGNTASVLIHSTSDC